MKRVQVYWNLHRQCYSVRQSGRVIDHVTAIALRDVRFNVAPAGRDKVRATGVKNVHATVSGYHTAEGGFQMQYVDDMGWITANWDVISYNPFKYNQFVKLLQCDMYAPITNADYVALLPNREIRAWGAK